MRFLDLCLFPGPFLTTKASLKATKNGLPSQGPPGHGLTKASLRTTKAFFTISVLFLQTILLERGMAQKPGTWATHIHTYGRPPHQKPTFSQYSLDPENKQIQNSKKSKKSNPHRSPRTSPEGFEVWKAFPCNNYPKKPKNPKSPIPTGVFGAVLRDSKSGRHSLVIITQKIKKNNPHRSLRSSPEGFEVWKAFPCNNYPKKTKNPKNPIPTGILGAVLRASKSGRHSLVIIIQKIQKIKSPQESSDQS